MRFEASLAHCIKNIRQLHKKNPPTLHLISLDFAALLQGLNQHTTDEKKIGIENLVYTLHMVL